MTKFFTAAAAAALALPVAAHAEDQKFTRDGTTYVYSTATHGKTTLISGRAIGGSSFRLRVQNGRVTGMSGGVPVAFDVPADKTATQISMR